MDLVPGCVLPVGEEPRPGILAPEQHPDPGQAASGEVARHVFAQSGQGAGRLPDVLVLGRVPLCTERRVVGVLAPPGGIGPHGL